MNHARIAFTGRPRDAAHVRDVMRALPSSGVAILVEYDGSIEPIAAQMITAHYDTVDIADVLDELSLCVAFGDTELSRAAERAGVQTQKEVAMKAHEFIWMDLETTGLEPLSGKILEFAVVLCEDARGDDFAIVEEYAAAIHHAVAREIAEPAVQQMHDSNGLWRDVAASTTTLSEADDFLASLAESLGAKPQGLTLAGSSVHFDLAWCRVWLPRFARYLSHRVFDVSTLRRAVDSWSATPIDWPARNTHRALDDVRASIAEARVARKAMGL